MSDSEDEDYPGANEIARKDSLESILKEALMAEYGVEESEAQESVPKDTEFES